MMATTWRLVAFPMILPWRPEFWTLPLFFPDLTVGVLWQWPPGLPYQGRPLPPQAAAGTRDVRHYAPGELKQWQAYEEYASSREEIEDIVRALRGEPAQPRVADGPWQDEEAASLAWQLEVMEADQEAHLARVDRGEEWLAEILAPEPLEEPGSFSGSPGALEFLDPETARLRYLLWRREMGALLGAESAPFLLGRTSQTIFASLRQEVGTVKPPLVRFKLPGCRTEEEYQAARKAGGAPEWLKGFQELLGACLTAADQRADLKLPAQEFTRWLAEELPRYWADVPSWTWDLEIWGRDPEAGEGGETLLAWAGLGKEVLPG
jgi:hypothetical protein